MLQGDTTVTVSQTMINIQYLMVNLFIVTNIGNVPHVLVDKYE
jgi:hypothetical protein